LLLYILHADTPSFHFMLLSQDHILMAYTDHAVWDGCSLGQEKARAWKQSWLLFQIRTCF